jgi:ROS/MUCR transcriptional regulator protein
MAHSGTVETPVEKTPAPTEMPFASLRYSSRSACFNRVGSWGFFETWFCGSCSQNCGSRAALPIRKSITPGFLICLDDGKRLKTLKRHLTNLGMTPDHYRAKWRLPDSCMVAPEYAATRSALAKKSGLGQTAKRIRDRHPRRSWRRPRYKTAHSPLGRHEVLRPSGLPVLYWFRAFSQRTPLRRVVRRNHVGRWCPKCIVKTNKYRRFSASKVAEHGGNS